MKELWRYKFWDELISSFALAIIMFFMSKEWKVMRIGLFLSSMLFIILLILFLNECYKSNLIRKNGVFILGKLDGESMKFRYIPQTRYMIKFYVEYYDEKRKVILKFQGYDTISKNEIPMKKVRELMNKDKELDVLVGYLPEQPEICEVYLKEAFERT